MGINEMTKTERKYLSEAEFISAPNGNYHYNSRDGSHEILLDHILLDYKEWLIENGFVSEK